MNTKVVDTVVAKVEEGLAAFMQRHPRIPNERIKTVKANMVERAHKVALDQEFKDQLKEGIEFLRSTMAVPLEFSAYNIEFSGYQIDVGFAVDPRNSTCSAVVNLCSPEDSMHGKWRPHIACGLLGYRLKQAVEFNHDSSWHYPIVRGDMLDFGSKMEIIRNILDTIHTWALDDDSRLPHCLRRKVAECGYRANSVWILPIKLPTRRSRRDGE